MTDQRLHAHWRWHHQTPEHEHTNRTARMEDWTPHTGARTDTEQRDEPHHKTNHDPAYPEGDEGIYQTKYAYTWHTGQIPPHISHCFIAIFYIIDTDRRFTRWTQVPTWILDSRQVSTSFSPLYYGCIRPYSQNSIQNLFTPIENLILSNHRLPV